jgi:hypothetical protein
MTKQNKAHVQKRIILADHYQFLHDIFKNAIEKSEKLQIVAEVYDLEDYQETAKRLNADWTLLLLHPEEAIPDVIEDALMDLPSMRLMVMATDGSKVTIRWAEMHDHDLDIKLLDEVIEALETYGVEIDENNIVNPNN